MVKKLTPYIILASIVLLLVVVLYGCLPMWRRQEEKEIQAIKEEFSQFHTDNDVMLDIDGDHLYFDTHVLDLSNMVENEDAKAYEINDGVVCFATTRSNGLFDFSLQIYTCDMYGNDLRLLAEKEHYKTVPSVIIQGDMVYICHNTQTGFVPSSQVIDSFNWMTGEYKQEASGEDCDLSDFKRDPTGAEPSHYTVDIVSSSEDRKAFVIRNTETQETKTVDDAFVQDTIYAELMNKHGYSPKRFDISQGHILLTYWIGDAGEFPHLIFEYDFETHTLIYKALVSPYDSVPIDILYVGASE